MTALMTPADQKIGKIVKDLRLTRIFIFRQNSSDKSI